MVPFLQKHSTSLLKSLLASFAILYGLSLFVDATKELSLALRLLSISSWSVLCFCLTYQVFTFSQNTKSLIANGFTYFLSNLMLVVDLYTSPPSQHKEIVYLIGMVSTVLGMIASINWKSGKAPQKIENFGLESIFDLRPFEITEGLSKDAGEKEDFLLKVVHENNKLSTIGISGPWGIGKTSLIHSLVSTLEKDRRYKITHIDSSNYFSSESLVEELREKYLSIFFGENPNIFTKAVFESMLSSTPNILSSVVQLVTNSDSQIATKKLLSNHLESSDDMYVIIYDDLDRLKPEEVVVALRLIGKIAGVPKIKQIVLYDRVRIESLLHDSSHGHSSFFAKYIDYELHVHALDYNQSNNQAKQYIMRVLEQEGMEHYLTEISKTNFESEYYYLLNNYRDLKQFAISLHSLLKFGAHKIHLQEAIKITILKTRFPKIYLDMFEPMPGDEDKFVALYQSIYGNQTHAAFTLVSELSNGENRHHLFKMINPIYTPIYQMDKSPPNAISWEGLKMIIDGLKDNPYSHHQEIPSYSFNYLTADQLSSNFIGIVQAIDRSLHPSFVALTMKKICHEKDGNTEWIYHSLREAISSTGIFKSWINGYLSARAKVAWTGELKVSIMSMLLFKRVYKPDYPVEFETIKANLFASLPNFSYEEVLSLDQNYFEILENESGLLRQYLDHMHIARTSILNEAQLDNLLEKYLEINGFNSNDDYINTARFMRMTSDSQHSLVTRLIEVNNGKYLNVIRVIKSFLKV
ncbi:P-loop NTPase fold protein [Bdellovibrio bacteriovorus]|uniref:KAP NTPase domain-containing protein n=1 Tax=Bdellovibrio bacteriovorus (strain ATCC 15356 / DSM 50701 / NCIMB 9529 / HD100) TaxID=264462 RepID=Q6MR98_BDEBA|nr:P-loop NTPase fold protein [Bdellovibrio bacteriovorus]CAE77860.1 hypothetical protein with phage excl. prot. domain [Bdellovibrio bacteriovorus HD100]